MTALPRRLGLGTATLTVIANMIGTGVFTTTGILLGQLHSPRWVLVAWLGGGLMALFGAFAYGELGARSGKNGGEYRFLTDIIHPSLGFVTAWISLAVGFSAPIAASAIAFGRYASALAPGVSAPAAAAALVVALSTLHAARVGAGARLQNVFTAGKVLLIVGFTVGALAARGPGVLVAAATAEVDAGFGVGSFAVALILVSFAYSGWNGAAYLAGELKSPGRTLPLALVAGTTVVLALYLGLNAVFLGAVPADELAGEVEVGHIAAVALFGDAAGRVLSGLISLALVSSVSAMIMVGPRVYEAAGEDFPRLAWLAARRGKTGPVASTALQGALAVVMIVTATFETLLIYIGLTLSLSAALAVACVFIDRRRHPQAPRPYRAFGHPVTSALFIAFMLLTVGWSITEQPAAAAASAATIAAGFALYAVVRTPN